MAQSWRTSRRAPESPSGVAAQVCAVSLQECMGGLHECMGAMVSCTAYARCRKMRSPSGTCEAVSNSAQTPCMSPDTHGNAMQWASWRRTAHSCRAQRRWQSLTPFPTASNTPRSGCPTCTRLTSPSCRSAEFPSHLQLVYYIGRLNVSHIALYRLASVHFACLAAKHGSSVSTLQPPVMHRSA